MKLEMFQVARSTTTVGKDLETESTPLLQPFVDMFAPLVMQSLAMPHSAFPPETHEESSN